MSEAVRAKDAPTEATGSAPAVSLEDAVERFGEVVALEGVTLDVAPGEFFSLLGP